MKRGLSFFITSVVLLGACTGTPVTLETSIFYNDTLSDEQGAVSVAVTPLGGSSGELTFDVAMNTHSVDLSMDLATLATLSNDKGQTVRPTGWDAPQSGHHVAGKLTFPIDVDGVSLLDGAKRVTLVIREVDVPERVFVWTLGEEG